MQRLLIALTTAALLALPTFASAQIKNQPGQSEWAPGQRAKEPGQAKKFAPGQQERRKDLDHRPGAKEYAPGQK